MTKTKEEWTEYFTSYCGIEPDKTVDLFFDDGTIVSGTPRQIGDYCRRRFSVLPMDSFEIESNFSSEPDESSTEYPPADGFKDGESPAKEKLDLRFPPDFHGEYLDHHLMVWLTRAQRLGEHAARSLNIGVRFSVGSVTDSDAKNPDEQCYGFIFHAEENDLSLDLIKDFFKFNWEEYPGFSWQRLIDGFKKLASARVVILAGAGRALEQIGEVTKDKGIVWKRGGDNNY